MIKVESRNLLRNDTFWFFLSFVPPSYNHVYGYPTLNFKKYLVGIIYNQKKAKKKDNVACAMYGVDVVVVCDVFTITPCWILLYSKNV